MALRKKLTNEDLKKNFDNPFALVSRAIAMAAALVAREEEQDSYSGNLVSQVLEMISSGQEVPTRGRKKEEE